ncbi:4-Cys prefix domain-containing protein [Chlorogloeopsis sp. ULAP01]|uniref:4-Cys prefix domain-containing protein n=1 Tax=Chlorogloeopsis sp. ULAP01 TaxID=3056483 RepID=UPI003015490A
MSYCINPICSKPQNTRKTLFREGCGSELLLDGCYRVTHLLSDRRYFGFKSALSINFNSDNI